MYIFFFNFTILEKNPENRSLFLKLRPEQFNDFLDFLKNGIVAKKIIYTLKIFY